MVRKLSQAVRRRPHLEILEDRTVLTAAVALTTTNELLMFELENPGQTTMQSIQGLQDGETVLGIDYRPRDYQLYGITNANRMVRLSTATGMATQIGTAPFSVPLVGSKFGVDFNPTVDRMRVVSDAEQNLRLNPDTGAVAAEDATLWYSHIDVFYFTDPNVVAAAYLNNVDGANSTLLFVIDSYNSTVALQAPPNDGVLSTFGYIELNSSDLIGLDIVNEADGFAIFSVGLFETPTLYYIDVFSGSTFLLGEVGTNRLVSDLALVLTPPGGPGSFAGKSDDVFGLLPDAPLATPFSQETAAPAEFGATTEQQPILPRSAETAVTGAAPRAQPQTAEAVERVFTDGTLFQLVL